MERAPCSTATWERPSAHSRSPARATSSTYGCGEFTRACSRKGLVDEFWFWIHPAVWGPGDRLFEEVERLRLRLVDTEAFDSGVVLLRYAPGSPRGDPG